MSDLAVGGQAVIEGVMMRGKRMYAMAVRKPDNNIEMVTKPLNPISERYPIFKLPLLRGMAAFCESLAIGYSITSQSVEIASQEEELEPPSKFEKFLEDKLGDKFAQVLIIFSILVSIVLAMGLFAFLPVWISSFANPLLQGNTWALGIFEGIAKVLIFVVYILLISKNKDIQRVFQYHGAEHKTINCYENGEELTVDNIKNHTRLHKRCGTSFLLLVMLVSIFVFIFVRSDILWIRFGFKLLLIPLIAGISYELIKYAGKKKNIFVSIISYPGLCLQHLTTKEPDEGQIEIAVAALKEVLKEGVPKEDIPKGEMPKEEVSKEGVSKEEVSKEGVQKND